MSFKHVVGAIELAGGGVLTPKRAADPLIRWAFAAKEAYARMSEEERAELHAWEAEHVNGSGEYGSDDWPGWAEHIGDIQVVVAPRRRAAPTPKASIPTDLRWAVWERDDFRCRHCGTRRRLSIDHIIPESQGGPTELDNLQTLCMPCNSRKGAR